MDNTTDGFDVDQVTKEKEDSWYEIVNDDSLEQGDLLLNMARATAQSFQRLYTPEAVTDVRVDYAGICWQYAGQYTFEHVAAIDNPPQDPREWEWE